MSKILSQAGNSLADTYDVEGSVAGIETLETRELPIVHEMGGTVFSERFRTTIVRVASGNLNQNVDINLVTTDLPVTISRLLGVAVVTDDAARILRLACMVRDPITGGGREFPVWVWDGATGETIRMEDEGVGTDFTLLAGPFSSLSIPTFCGGLDTVGTVAGAAGTARVNEMALRGRTTGFGAGTVFVRAFYFVAFTDTPGVSSRGLPVPSW